MDEIEILNMIYHMERNSKKPLPDDIIKKKTELEKQLQNKKQKK